MASCLLIPQLRLRISTDIHLHQPRLRRLPHHLQHPLLNYPITPSQAQLAIHVLRQPILSTPRRTRARRVLTRVHPHHTPIQILSNLLGQRNARRSLRWRLLGLLYLPAFHLRGLITLNGSPFVPSSFQARSLLRGKLSLPASYQRRSRDCALQQRPAPVVIWVLYNPMGGRV